MPACSNVITTVGNMGQSYYKRYTLFKIPKEEDIDAVLKQYDVLRATAVKVSRPLAGCVFPILSSQPLQNLASYASSPCNISRR